MISKHSPPSPEDEEQRTSRATATVHKRFNFFFIDSPFAHRACAHRSEENHAMKVSKKTLALIALFGAVFIAYVAKSQYYDALNPKYHAALYYAHVRAVDDQTSEPISVEVEWDYEQISPYSKGSAPSVIQSNEDKSVTIALVGKKLDEGLKVTLASRGYYREELVLDPDKTWTVSAASSKIETIVRFKRTNSKD